MVKGIFLEDIQRIEIGARPIARFELPTASVLTTPVFASPRCTSIPNDRSFSATMSDVRVLKRCFRMSIYITPPGAHIVSELSNLILIGIVFPILDPEPRNGSLIQLQTMSRRVERRHLPARRHRHVAEDFR